MNEEPLNLVGLAKLFEHLLDQGTVRVIVSPGDTGVVGLNGVATEAAKIGDRTFNLVHLDYNRGFAVPVPIDLVVDETGIGATLSFSGTPRKTFVPWEAVMCFHLEEGEIEQRPQPTEKKRGHLKLV